MSRYIEIGYISKYISSEVNSMSRQGGYVSENDAGETSLLVMNGGGLGG